MSVQSATYGRRKINIDSVSTEMVEIDANDAVRRGTGHTYAEITTTWTPTGSPWTFVNNTGSTINFTVTGGTVSKIETDQSPAVNFKNTGVTSGTFSLQPQAALRVTYSVVPTVTHVVVTNS